MVLAVSCRKFAWRASRNGWRVCRWTRALADIEVLAIMAVQRLRCMHGNEKPFSFGWEKGDGGGYETLTFIGA